MRPREAMTAAAHIQEMWRSSCESIGEGFAVSTSTVALPMRAVPRNSRTSVNLTYFLVLKRLCL